MSELKYFEHVFVWHSLSDACPKCRQLNQRQWHSQQLYMERLWDPFYGDIWDMHQGSLAHPNCRCQLEVRTAPVSADELLQMLQKLEANLLQLNSELTKLVGET